MKKTLAVAACFAFLGMASSAMAYTFGMGSGSYVDGDAFSDPGLVMQYAINPGLGSLSYDLGVGESQSFLFATFWTNENWVNYGEDTVPQSLTAHVDFDQPDLFGIVNGDSVGTSYLFGFFQGWNIQWDGPVSIPFGYENTGSFTLQLSDASFSSGFWTGPDGTRCDYSADVWATVTLDSEPVPEPATMLLFGTGLAGLAGSRLRRKRK